MHKKRPIFCQKCLYTCLKGKQAQGIRSAFYPYNEAFQREQDKFFLKENGIWKERKFFNYQTNKNCN